MQPVYLAIAAALVIVVGIICFVLGSVYRKAKAERELGSAEAEAKRILTDAMKNAEAKKKEAVLEAKDEIHHLRTEADKEIKERRSEVQRQERRLTQEEESLDRKIENHEKKEEKLAEKVKLVEEKQAELDDLKIAQRDMLKKISGYTVEQAKAELLKSVEEELVHDKAVMIKDYEQKAREEAEKRARNIIALSIQRCAADHTSETTVSVVALPNDEMKGRIIGREGRNITALEQKTGVDLIIDDTPEAITVSCFDPIRREIARTTLEKLIADGRIHPTKIEEMYDKAKREVESIIKSEGEKAVLDTGVRGINHELVKLLGKLHFRTSFGQNVLKHSLEVSYISGLIAAELGEDVTLAKRAGLLHDIGKALDHEMEGSHIQLGVDVAKKYKESDAVVHAIHAHHGDVEAKTVIACIVQAADAISASRPGARRENIENYIKRLERLEEIANSFHGVERSFAIQAGREIRIVVKPNMVSDDQMVIVARDVAKQIESELDYPGQIKVNVIRESRATDYAK